MKKVLIAVLITVCFFSNAQAAFENLDICGRSSSLGNTYISIADDVSALYLNPAGISFLQGKMAGFSYSKLNLGLGNLNNGFVGVILPLQNSLAIGAFVTALSEETLYSEKTYGFILSFKTVVSENNSVSLGVTIKDMVKEIGVTQDVIDNPLLGDKKSASGVSVDAGILYRMDNFGSVGLSVLNANQPNIYFIDEDKVPMTIKVGASFDIFKGFVAGAGFNYFNSDYIVDFGCEYKEPQLGLNGRLDMEIGSKDYKKVNVGLGVDYNIKRMGLCVVLDYGFKFPISFISNVFGTHVLSVTFKEIQREEGEGSQ